MRVSVLVWVMLGLCATAQGQVAPYQDVKLSPEVRAHDLVSRMTLEEKALQSVNTAPAIARLGVPAYDYWSEGLHGIARSGYSTLFPQAIGMASTFDAPLLHGIGEVVSTEARAKYNDAVSHGIHSIYFGLTIWSPNINIFRDPRWGRGQETYGEDPYLTGELAKNFIGGLQGPDPEHPRVIATAKHFAVHSGPESTRHRANVDPTEHDLWDTYLPQFRAAIVDAHADSIMCAYNAVDGVPACASDLLLNKVLRNDWKFKGFVTSDCGAVDDIYEGNGHHYVADKEHAAAAAVKMGTDTECGSVYKILPAAVGAGLLKESDLDKTLERLFVARIKLGLFDPPQGQPYANIPYSEDRSAEHLALSRRASNEAMVLLKNDGILPLSVGKYKTIAVVGPNAASLAALEGNYNAVPRDPEMPVDSVRKAFPGAQVIYAQGAPYAQGAALAVPRTMLHPSADSKEQGLKAEYFAIATDTADDRLTGPPVVTRVDPEIDFDWNSAAPVEGLQQQAFGVRWSGVIVPPVAGDFDFNMRLAHCYPCGDHEHFTVMIDGKPVSQYGTKGDAGRESTTPRFRVTFADTHPHAVEIEYIHKAPLFGGGITLEWVPPAGMLQQQAKDAISKADLVIAMVGLSPELEGEEMKVHVQGFDGGDRTDIQLPQSQVELLQEVAAAAKPMVVVMLNGSAVAAPFAEEHANAVLEAWYPGEFGGAAIADTLTGRNNPAGRLPVTFYRSVSQLPDFSDYSMKNRTYRYFTGKPLYEFGYGLSYTKFTYSNLKLSQENLQAGHPLTVEVEVANTGKAAGDEVAELYLKPPSTDGAGLSPQIELEGFQRVHLDVGQHRRLQFSLDARQLSEVDGSGERHVLPGDYVISVGGAQPDDPKSPTPATSAVLHITGSAAVAR